MPYFMPYPVIYNTGATAPHGQKTESGVKVLMYSFLIGALTSVAAGLAGLAPSQSGFIAAFCFGFLLGGIALVMGLVALIRIFADRASFGDEHSRHVRLALAFYVAGFIGIIITAVFGAATFPDAREAVSTPGFTFTALIPQRAAVALFGVIFTTFSFLGTFFILRGLQPDSSISFLKSATIFAVVLELAISLAQFGVFVAAVPQLDAAVASRSAQKVESILDAYDREAGLLALLAVFYNVLFAYVAFLVLTGFPALREKHAPRTAPPMMPFMLPGPMPPMMPYGAPFPGYPFPLPSQPQPQVPASPLVITPVPCPRCRGPAEFISEYNRYYCRPCSQYL